MIVNYFLLSVLLAALWLPPNFSSTKPKSKKKIDYCLQAFFCGHNGKRKCGLIKKTREIRRFIDSCDMLEFNCQYKTVFIVLSYLTIAMCHGPPKERDNEDVAMGRKVKKVPMAAPLGKMAAKWCGMAKMCNHDRVPVCGISHSGDVMGFRDLCDMFDFNCIRRRNYKQVACPEDKSILTASRRPTAGYYDD